MKNLLENIAGVVGGLLIIPFYIALAGLPFVVGYIGIEAYQNWRDTDTRQQVIESLPNRIETEEQLLSESVARESFLEGCLVEGGDNATCVCMYEKVRSEYSINEIVGFGGGAEIPDRVWELALSCWQGI